MDVPENYIPKMVLGTAFNSYVVYTERNTRFSMWIIIAGTCAIIIIGITLSIIICSVLCGFLFPYLKRKHNMQIVKLRDRELVEKLLQETKTSSSQISFDIDKSLFEIDFNTLENLEGKVFSSHNDYLFFSPRDWCWW